MARPRTFVLLSGIGALSLVPARASAAPEGDGPAFRVSSYEAPEGTCPDRDAFVAEILARTRRPRLADDETSPAIDVRVVLEAEPERASGRLDLREPDGTSETRAVTSRTCAEVARALALVTALLLDPDARTEPEPLPEPEPEPPPPPPVRPPPRPAPRRPPPPPPPPPPSPWQASAGAEAGIHGGIGPAAAPVAGVFAEIERGARARLSFQAARTASDLPNDAAHTYEWVGATARVCPVHLALPGHLRVAPCGAFEIAAHRATTQRVKSPTTNLELWLAPAALASVEWTIRPDVAVELQGGALFPLRRTRFFLAPSTTLFEVPAAAGTATLGVRLRFL